MITPLWRGLRGKCPNCGEGAMADGLFRAHQRCEVCGLVYTSAPGDFTGAAVMSYALTSTLVLALGFGLLLFTELSVWTVFGIGTVITLIFATLTYQPLRGLWVGILVYLEWIQAPPVD